jgi:hypothetical protein
VNSRLACVLQAITFLVSSTKRLLTAPGGSVIYTRNPFDLLIVPLLRSLRPDVNLFFEDHDGVLRRFPSIKKVLLRGVCGIVVTTSHHALHSGCRRHRSRSTAWVCTFDTAAVGVDDSRCARIAKFGATCALAEVHVAAEAVRIHGSGKANRGEQRSFINRMRFSSNLTIPTHWRQASV